MYDQDSDVLRWGLDLLSGDPFANAGYRAAITNYYDSEEHPHGMNCATLESDELMAWALQQEFTQLAVSEAFGPSDSDEENFQANLLQILQSSSKQHVPRVNGDIPSIDEATTDHQRLLDRLCPYDLVELKVIGDGNCQFRALSDQFYRTTEHHKFVRQQVIKQLKGHSDIYEAYVPMAYGDYLIKLSKNGEWGDHVTLQAAADSSESLVIANQLYDGEFVPGPCTHCQSPHLHRNVYFTKSLAEIVPRSLCLSCWLVLTLQVICMSFWAEVHYNSIYPEGGTELPARGREGGGTLEIKITNKRSTW